MGNQIHDLAQKIGNTVLWINLQKFIRIYSKRSDHCRKQAGLANTLEDHSGWTDNETCENQEVLNFFSLCFHHVMVMSMRQPMACLPWIFFVIYAVAYSITTLPPPRLSDITLEVVQDPVMYDSTHLYTMMLKRWCAMMSRGFVRIIGYECSRLIVIRLGGTNWDLHKNSTNIDTRMLTRVFCLVSIFLDMTSKECA